MYTGTRIILATVNAKPGKLDRVIELYQQIIKFGETNEPGCVEFQLFTEVDEETGRDRLFTIERFKDLEALRSHQKNPALAAFNKSAAEEDLIEEIGVKVVKPVSGFQV